MGHFLIFGSKIKEKHLANFILKNKEFEDPEVEEYCMIEKGDYNFNKHFSEIVKNKDIHLLTISNEHTPDCTSYYLSLTNTDKLSIDEINSLLKNQELIDEYKKLLKEINGKSDLDFLSRFHSFDY